MSRPGWVVLGLNHKLRHASTCQHGGQEYQSHGRRTEAESLIILYASGLSHRLKCRNYPIGKTKCRDKLVMDGAGGYVAEATFSSTCTVMTAVKRVNRVLPKSCFGDF